MLESILIAAEKVAEKTVEQAIEKTIELTNEIAKSLESERITSTAKEASDLTNRILNPTEIDKTKSYKAMFNEIEAAKTNPETLRALYNKMEINPNIIGQSGEYCSQKILEGYGEVQNQIPSGSNKIDFGIEKTTSNIEFNELQNVNGQLEINNTYLPKNSSLAMEVKNGSFDYFRNQVNGSGSHLLEQIKAGAKEFNNSFVGINKDLEKSLMANPDRALPLLEKINDAGGKLVTGPPDIITQKIIIGELIAV